MHMYDNNIINILEKLFVRLNKEIMNLMSNKK